MTENQGEGDELAKRDFAGRLKVHVDQSPLSQRELADAAGVAVGSITNWTQGKSEPNLRSLRGLSGALGVPMAALVGDEEDLTEAYRKVVTELANLRLRPAVRQLGDVAPSLLDLLSEAERLAGGGEES